MFALLFYFFASHIVSFTCSILEAVLLCCTNSHIAVMKKKKPYVGNLLHDLKARIDRPLAAILTLNTAAHTFGAAGVGAKVVEIYGNHWLALASIGLTLTMLYLTEMIPKTLGALYWKKWSGIAAYTIRFLIILTYPFVFSFVIIARYLKRGKKHEKITGEEIKLVLEEGMQAGVIKEVEQDMLESIFRLGSRRVGVLMIPRLEIEWLDLKEDPVKLRAKIESSKHNRFPVCNGDLDEVVGLVRAKDVLNEILYKGTFDLEKLAWPPVFVPENMRVLQLVDLFKKTPNHIALVTDEYGGIQGLITLHDVLESIVGEVPTTSAGVTETHIFQRKDGSWMVDGMLPIDELKEHFELDSLPDEEKGSYRTLGGFCMRQMGSIPNVGDSFYWGGLLFRISKMEGRRVEKIIIYKATDHEKK